MVKTVMTCVVAAGLALATGACGQGNKANVAGNNAAAAANAAAPTNVAAANAAQPAAATSEAEVRAFLDHLYAPYAAAEGQSPAWDAIFEPGLAASIGDEEGEPETDPLIEAQDYTPFRPTIEAVAVNGDRAVATATFTNGGEATEQKFELIRTPAGWRVYDIRSSRGSLRERHPARAR